MDVNSVILIGRLTRDSELRFTSTGLAICEFSIAVNRRKKENDDWVNEASFFSVTLFGRQGEAIQRYLSKGKQVGVQGELRQERWEQDGQKRSKISIIANNVQLLGGSARGESGGVSEFPQPAENSTEQTGVAPATEDDNFKDDIPF